MRVGSLFSGIGGLDLGLERAGMTIAWQVEIDEFCSKVLAKHWPDVPKYGDIRELTGDELEPVDLIAAGFPCQPVSTAGRKLGTADPRWLWPDVARILRVVRPRWVLLENVPGLRVRGMGEVLGDLAALGYDAEWDCLPAAAFGAPHIRDRVFIVAHARCCGRDAGGQLWRWQTDPGRRRETLADANGTRLAVGPVFGGNAAEELATFVRGCSAHWATEPDVGRVAHGVPHRVDRIRALGNAVVPQVAQWIGERILEADARLRGEEGRHHAA